MTMPQQLRATGWAVLAAGAYAIARWHALCARHMSRLTQGWIWAAHACIAAGDRCMYRAVTPTPTEQRHV